MIVPTKICWVPTSLACLFDDWLSSKMQTLFVSEGMKQQLILVDCGWKLTVWRQRMLMLIAMTQDYEGHPKFCFSLMSSIRALAEVAAGWWRWRESYFQLCGIHQTLTLLSLLIGSSRDNLLCGPRGCCYIPSAWQCAMVALFLTSSLLADGGPYPLPSVYGRVQVGRGSIYMHESSRCSKLCKTALKWIKALMYLLCDHRSL